MNDSSFRYNLTLEDKRSEKTISENPNYKYVSNIIDYHKDERILSIKDNKETVTDREASFKIPIIKTTDKLDGRNYSRASYSWICYVTSINKEIFTARVEEIRSNLKTFEEAEFEILDLDDEDMKMLKIGAVFYWSIGYEYRNGTKKKESFIRFKMLPIFNEMQINNALDLSTELFQNLNWVD
jgi:hypothetical protein